MASLFGATIGLAMTQLMTPHDLETYGWRIAFGLGAIVLPFGLILRRTLPETLHRREAPSSVHPTARSFTSDDASHSRAFAVPYGDSEARLPM